MNCSNLQIPYQIPKITPPRCQDFQISSIGFGALQLSFMDNREAAKTLIMRAYEKGVNFIDTAAVYGPSMHHNEKLVGQAIQAVKKKYPDAVIHVATKCGIDFASGYQSSPKALKKSINASLASLGIDKISVLYLHRVEPNLPLEKFHKALETLQKYVDEGKVQYLGLSETSAKYIKIANEFFASHNQGHNPLAFVQSAYSLATRRAEKNGVLKICHELGIQFIAYTSLMRGLISSSIQSHFSLKDIESLEVDQLFEKLGQCIKLGDFEKKVGFFQKDVLRLNLKDVWYFQALAKKHDILTSQLALAWLQFKKKRGRAVHCA